MTGPQEQPEQPEPTGRSEPVLELEDLTVGFGHDGETQVVHGVSLRIDAGEMVGMVGESGSGKTMTAMAAAALLPSGATSSTSTWRFEGRDLRTADRSTLAEALGGRLAVVFQDPMSSLNPARRIGAQMSDVVRVHGGRSRAEALADAVDRLRRVRIAHPERRVRDHPHRFSGGMRQRAMIAMGLMSTPRLLVADEPTTALDVTVQADVMDLITELNRNEGTAVLLVSHNISLVAEVCHRVVVMYAGRIVERLDVADLQRARHPYTRALIGSVPTLDGSRDEPLVTIPGSPPDPAHLPGGCAFADRCPLVEEQCRSEVPPLVHLDGSDDDDESAPADARGAAVACHVAIRETTGAAR